MTSTAPAPGTGRRHRLAGAVARTPGEVWVLAAMIATYVAVFATLTAAQHANFGTFGFDMGIYDQGIWLMSRFEDPFITVRGLPYFGHHMNLLTVLFVPAYWLGAGPIFLYVVETVALALGAVPIWLLGRDRWGSARLALVPAAAFLLYPSIEWINWWHFHPDALIVTPLLFAWWLASRGRWAWYWVALAVALAAKEDAALAVFVLGLVVALRWHRGRGLWTAGFSLWWFVVATRLLIPLLTGGDGPFYNDFFADFEGDSTTSVALDMAANPGTVMELLTEPGRLEYYFKMLVPVAFLPLVGPLAFAVGIPQLLVNSLSSHTPLHEIRFHYSSVVSAAAFLGTVEGVAWLARGSAVRLRALAGVLAVAAAVSHVAYSPSPLGRDFDTGVWARSATPRHDVLNEALDLVPDDAGISATYYLVPHLTQRRHIYEWPNPFVPTYWGVSGEDPHPPERADYLVLDLRLVGREHQALLDRLLVTSYEVELRRDDVLVARRVR